LSHADMPPCSLDELAELPSWKDAVPTRMSGASVLIPARRSAILSRSRFDY
jgi:hypothetical protein